MILCHKCDGILHANASENTVDLAGCGCISGYVRGFEPDVSREQAIRTKIESTQCALKLCAERIRRFPERWAWELKQAERWGRAPINTREDELQRVQTGYNCCRHRLTFLQSLI